MECFLCHSLQLSHNQEMEISLRIFIYASFSEAQTKRNLLLHIINFIAFIFTINKVDTRLYRPPS